MSDKEYYKEYYIENKDKIKQQYINNKEKIKQRYIDNKEKINEYNKQRYLVNKDKILKQQGKRNKEHIEERKEYDRQHYLENKDKIKQRQDNWRQSEEGKECKKIYRNNKKLGITMKERKTMTSSLTLLKNKINAFKIAKQTLILNKLDTVE